MSVMVFEFLSMLMLLFWYLLVCLCVFLSMYWLTQEYLLVLPCMLENLSALMFLLLSLSMSMLVSASM
jgi:hypothetical protein